MHNVKEYRGTLEILKRLPQSENGNPRWLCNIGGMVCRTSVDSSLGYKVPNLDGKEVRARVGVHYRTATIADIERA